MNKATTFLDSLSETELELFEKSMRDGTLHDNILRKKEFFKLKDKQCPICGNTVDESCLVLHWGNSTLRKKAHFCGVDCLEFFISKNIKTKTKLKKTAKNQ